MERNQIEKRCEDIFVNLIAEDAKQNGPGLIQWLEAHPEILSDAMVRTSKMVHGGLIPNDMMCALESVPHTQVGVIKRMYYDNAEMDDAIMDTVQWCIEHNLIGKFTPCGDFHEIDPK